MLYQTQNPHGGDIYGETVLLDFSANTNPLGTPAGVVAAAQATLGEMHRYPDPYCRVLTQAIADFENVPKEYILCGNGAAELIYAYCTATRPKVALETAPTFSEYGLGLARVGCRMERYLLRKERKFALDAGFLACLKETMPQVVFLCNPNNPTGRTVDPELMGEIMAFCSKHDIRLFVDECFLDLADNGESMKSYLSCYPQLFILKGFTKSYGMAGLRLGYGLSSDSELLRDMSQEVQPWNVSSVAQAAGVAALGEQEFLKKTRALIACERAWMQEELEKIGFWVCPSAANYLLFQGVQELDKQLREKKIAIRPCSNYHGLEANWYRVAVRRHEENQQLIHGIKEVVSWQRT